MKLSVESTLCRPAPAARKFGTRTNGASKVFIGNTYGILLRNNRLLDEDLMLAVSRERNAIDFFIASRFSRLRSPASIKPALAYADGDFSFGAEHDCQRRIVTRSNLSIRCSKVFKNKSNIIVGQGYGGKCSDHSR
jgi:hypothetical protein